MTRIKIPNQKHKLGVSNKTTVQYIKLYLKQQSRKAVLLLWQFLYDHQKYICDYFESICLEINSRNMQAEPYM